MPRTSQEVLATVRMLTDRLGHSPTFGEVGDHLGVTAGAIAHHVRKLVRDRLVERVHNRPRALRIVADTKPVVRLGPIPDGIDVTHESRVADTASPAVSAMFSPNPSYFVLMHDASLNKIAQPGDRIAIEATQTWTSGDVVLVRHGGELVLRRCTTVTDGSVILAPQSRDNTFKRAHLSRERMQVAGVMIGGIISRPDASGRRAP